MRSASMCTEVLGAGLCVHDRRFTLYNVQYSVLNVQYTVTPHERILSLKTDGILCMRNLVSVL